MSPLRSVDRDAGFSIFKTMSFFFFVFAREVDKADFQFIFIQMMMLIQILK